MLTPYDPWLVWVIPLVGALIIPVIGFFTKSETSKKLRDIIAVAFSGLAVIFAIFMIPDASPGFDSKVEWFRLSPTRVVSVGVLVDPLSVFVANVAADIGFLIMLYSIGYMRKEEDMGRYWFFMLFFIGGMILLVMSDNLLQLFLGWEIVGTCSWGLIGFWYKKSKDYDDPWIGVMPEGDYNAHSGMKAFVTTRVGDIALLTAILLIFLFAGTFNYRELESSTGWAVGLASFGLLLPTALLFFGGPIGKSAQFPLDVWLLEAMAGPTTVSALIHAAAMVKAGVYLIARFLPIFLIASATIPGAQIFPAVVAGIGAFTALLAATMGCVQREIKKVLACSTISQLGFMFLALGAGGLMAGEFMAGYAAGTLHLAAHAIFKALLFLGAGAVLHSVESIYMDEMGGLRKKMPITFTCMLIGALSLSGIPPFAGFFSKESIFEVLWIGGETNVFIAILFVITALTAVFTVFYSFRLIGLTFFGPESKHVKELEHEHGVHEAPAVMWVPLVILALFTVFFGFLGPLFDDYMGHAVDFTEFFVGIFTSITFILTLIIIAVGFIPAFYFYIMRRGNVEKLTKRGSVLGSFHRFFFNRWYINAFYYKIFVNGFLGLCRKMRSMIEERGIDRFNFVAARGFGRISNGLRKIHTGILSVNIIYIVAGAVLFLLILLLA
nr:NADH-quinone oxidoreductase subunit L [Candidatus Njordarchaeum guaymaensis]